MAKSSKICDNIYIYCVQNCEDFAIRGKLRNLPKIAKIQNCEDYLFMYIIYIYIYFVFSKLRRFRNKLRKLNIYAICSKLRRFRNLLKIAMISQNLICLYFFIIFIKIYKLFFEKYISNFLKLDIYIYIIYIYILIWNIYVLILI